MDKIDRAIIFHLKSDARISYKDLGEKVFLSANAVADRVRQLVSKKVVLGFSTDVSLSALGLQVQAIVDVKLSKGITSACFEAVIASIPGIVDATLLTGNTDYMLKVACVDQADLIRLIENVRERAGVLDTHSRLILKQIAVQDPVRCSAA